MPELDYTYEDTWNTRNNRLAYLGMTYDQYLNSEHWRRMRNISLKRPNYRKCECCSKTSNLHLHRSSYKWLGDEKNELRTVNSFCDHHHKVIHQTAKLCQISVRLSTNYHRNPNNTITKKPYSAMVTLSLRACIKLNLLWHPSCRGFFFVCTLLCCKFTTLIHKYLDFQTFA